VLTANSTICYGNNYSFFGFFYTRWYGAVHKRRPQSGVGRRSGLSSADILRTRWVFQIRASALYGAKNFGFLKINGVSARTRGIEQVRTFFGKGEKGVNFSRFCADVLYGWPLLHLRKTMLSHHAKNPGSNEINNRFIFQKLHRASHVVKDCTISSRRMTES